MVSVLLKPRTLWHYGLALGLLSCLLLGAMHMLVPDHWRHARSIDYAPQVAGLMEGRGFTNAQGETLDRYPPLYPLLLAVEFKVADALGMERRNVQSATSIAIVALTGVLVFASASLIVSPGLAALVGLASVVVPHLAYATLEPLSLVPYCLVLVAAIGLTWQQLHRNQLDPRASALLGLLLGVLMLLRPIALFLPILFLAFQQLAYRQWLIKARVKAGSALLLVLAVTLLPWEAWVYQQRGAWIPLSTGGANSLRDGISFNQKSFREPLTFNPRLTALQERIGNVYTDLNIGSEFRKFLKSELHNDPLAITQLYALKGLRAWYGTDSHNPRMEGLGKLLAVLYLVPTGLALMVLLWKRNRGNARTGSTRQSPDIPSISAPTLWLAGLLIAVIGYHWAFATAFLSVVRYMVPAYVLFPLIWCLGIQALGWAKNEDPGASVAP